MRKTLLVLAFVVLAFAVAGEPSARSFATQHTAMIAGKKVTYDANFEEFIVNDNTGKPALSLFVTSYVRKAVRDASERPVVFVFNGGPSGAATGLHMQFGPRSSKVADDRHTADAAPTFADNADSLLDVADLVMFDPAESGYSRVLPEGSRDYFYSTAGDTDSLAQLVLAWARRHSRESSPKYLLGESYGSIRQVVTGDLLSARGAPLDGQIILGDSIFLMETSRRSHNIISTAVSLPVLAMTAAYHGKADTHGLSDAAFLDEVYSFALGDYLIALSKGHNIHQADKRAIAERLAAYTGIPASYFLDHNLTIAKQDFNRELLPGKQLDASDTRIVSSALPPPKDPEEVRAQRTEQTAAPSRNLYGDYLHAELKVELPGLEYRNLAPDSFEMWDWGSGCNQYLQSAGLCTTKYDRRSIFVDYDWPEVLNRQFSNPKFRTMIIAGYYDGLSSIGTHRYLAAQLGYPSDRFELHEYPAGHATAADPAVRPKVLKDVKAFLVKAR